MVEKLEKRIRELEESFKENLEIFERRLEMIENSISEIYHKIEELKNEERFKQIEERINDVEDIEMLTRLEVLKLNEILKRTPLTGLSETLELRIDKIESSLETLEKKIATLTLPEEKIQKLEEMAQTLEKRISAEVQAPQLLSEEIKELKAKVDELERKTEYLKKFVEITVLKFGMLLKRVVESV